MCVRERELERARQIDTDTERRRDWQRLGEREERKRYNVRGMRRL